MIITELKKKIDSNNLSISDVKKIADKHGIELRIVELDGKDVCHPIRDDKTLNVAVWGRKNKSFVGFVY